MSQQGGGLEMGKMIEEQHVQVLQQGDDDDDNDEYEDDRGGARPITINLTAGSTPRTQPRLPTATEQRGKAEERLFSKFLPL